MKNEYELPMNSPFNLLRVNGWVVILKNNKPVNYYADHGETDVDYLFTDPVFSALAASLKNHLAIEDIIVASCELDKHLWDTHKLTRIDGC